LRLTFLSLFPEKIVQSPMTSEIRNPKSPINSSFVIPMRTFFRWIHLIFSIPIIGYIYSPFDQLPNYAPLTRYVFFPIIAVSGLWMWKGHLLFRRPAAKAS
jgi:hypothetical protein